VGAEQRGSADGMAVGSVGGAVDGATDDDDDESNATASTISPRDSFPGGEARPARDEVMIMQARSNG
jgi:hypothetical protein